MIQFQPPLLKIITRKERKESSYEKENGKMSTGLGIPSHPENSRLRLEVESFPGLALKLTRVQGKPFLWGQAASFQLDLLQGKIIPLPHTMDVGLQV